MVIAIVGVAFFTAKYFGLIFPATGPLHMPSTAMAGADVPAGSTVTAAFRMTETELDGPVELTAAEAVGVDAALDVGEAQVLVCQTKSLCVWSYTPRQWPPHRTDPRPVGGHVVDGLGHTRTVVGVPVTLPDGPGRYRIRGLEVEYRQGLRRYRAEVGPNLVYVVPR